MPRIVDHQARRTQLAEAVIRTVAGGGLSEVSLRHVAQEAHVSTGMVQHYFRSKDEMMAFALQVVSERVEKRIATTIRLHADRTGSPRGLVQAVLTEMLPVDEVRRREGLVALAFHAHAAVHPHTAERLRRGAADLQVFLAGCLRDARRSGDAPLHVQPDQEAVALLALVEGLSVQVLGQGCDPYVALRVFETYIDKLFTPPGPARSGE